MDDFYYEVEVNGLSAGRFESTKEAYLMKMSAEEEGDRCKIYCNGIDLTDNILLMGNKRGWAFTEIIG